MAQKNFIRLLPLTWRGIRDNIEALVIREDEWQDASNVDDDGTRPGITLVATPQAAVAVIGVAYYHRTDGTRHRVTTYADGKLFEDAVQIFTDLSGSPTSSADGLGGIIIFDPGGAAGKTARWRDPGDNTWKDLPIPSGWNSTVGVVDPATLRVYVAPTDLGPDTWGFSKSEDFTAWDAAGGGGQEPIGSDNQRITAIGQSVGDNLAIYKTNRIYIREGTDPANWKIRIISADIGAENARLVLPIGHGNFFVNTSGAHLLNALGAVTFPPLTDPIEGRWDTLAKTVDFSKGHMTWHPDERKLYLWLPDSGGVVQRLFKFSLQEQSVTEHLLQAGGSGYDGANLVIGRSDGKLVSHTGTDDLGVAIASSLTTKIFGDPLTQKSFGAVGQVIVLFRANAGASVTTTPRVYLEDTTVLGTPVVTAVATTALRRVRIPLPKTQGWAMELKFDATGVWRLVGLVLPEEIIGEI